MSKCPLFINKDPSQFGLGVIILQDDLFQTELITSAKSISLASNPTSLQRLVLSADIVQDLRGRRAKVKVKGQRASACELWGNGDRTDKRNSRLPGLAKGHPRIPGPIVTSPTPTLPQSHRNPQLGDSGSSPTVMKETALH